MSSYIFFAAHDYLTNHQAERINQLIVKIDCKAVFVRHHDAGSLVFGWLERPDDGTNDQRDVRARMESMKQGARDVLADYTGLGCEMCHQPVGAPHRAPFCGFTKIRQPDRDGNYHSPEIVYAYQAMELE